MEFFLCYNARAKSGKGPRLGRSLLSCNGRPLAPVSSRAPRAVRVLQGDNGPSGAGGPRLEGGRQKVLTLELHHWLPTGRRAGRVRVYARDGRQTLAMWEVDGATTPEERREILRRVAARAVSDVEAVSRRLPDTCTRVRLLRVTPPAKHGRSETTIERWLIEPAA